ncbi:hypothetical protein C8F04DRAFT_1303238 [Mycena alexandri]|uniref:Uncharacterized protein n=1 Tax=Mycena alexandri TaxID=1745969 RepID=A0AAD6SA68_9AGAR|nr:hypothetical protein C8F04DRAFT_1303238 [Mycena alexandri]
MLVCSAAVVHCPRGATRMEPSRMQKGPRERRRRHHRVRIVRGGVEQWHGVKNERQKPTRSPAYANEYSSRATENASIKGEKKGYNIRRTGGARHQQGDGQYGGDGGGRGRDTRTRDPSTHIPPRAAAPPRAVERGVGFIPPSSPDARTISSSRPNTKSAPSEDEAASSSRCTIYVACAAGMHQNACSVRIRNPRDSKETAPYNEKETSEREIKQKSARRDVEVASTHYTDGADKGGYNT